LIAKASKLFSDFFESEKSSGVILLICTIVSLIFANFIFGHWYDDLWNTRLSIPFFPSFKGFTLLQSINDGLMTVFFLLVGLEIEREIYIGELSDVKSALLPILAAVGGCCVPPIIHFYFNHGLLSQPGAGIPMATDIAFAVGIIALAGNAVPFSLKIFITALAIIDDLLAIVTISVFYSSSLHLVYLAAAGVVFGLLILLNRCGVNRILPYIAGGIILWIFMHHSGIHATITGVLLAFAIPFRDGKEKSPSYLVQNYLHRPVGFLIMPLFALANTGIVLNVGLVKEIIYPNSLGIIFGLFFGKVIGIVSATGLAHLLKIAKIPSDWTLRHLIGAGFIGGIGFTMSIFIALLAFENNQLLIEGSKCAILAGSLLSGFCGFILLRKTRK
jgi:Na+:H+ antiporter, NhaA family